MSRRACFLWRAALVTAVLILATLWLLDRGGWALRAPWRAAPRMMVTRDKGARPEVIVVQDAAIGVDPPVAISPDGRLALVGSDTEAILWNTETGMKLRTLAGHAHAIKSIAFTADGRRAFTASEGDHGIVLWDVETGEALRTLTPSVNTLSSGCAPVFSPDGRRALTAAGNDNATNLWDVETGKRLRTMPTRSLFNTFTRENFDATALAFSPDGRLVVTALYRGNVIVWDAAIGIKRRSFDVVGDVAALAFSPDGRRLFVGTPVSAGLYDAETGQSLRSWDVPPGSDLNSFEHGAMSAAFSADGKRVVTVGTVAEPPPGQPRAFMDREENMAVIWDGTTGAQLRKLQGHTKGIVSVAVSANGKKVLTGSRDRTVIVWDGETGAKIRAFERRSSGIGRVVFRPDGKQIVAGSIAWSTQNGSRLQVVSDADGVGAIAFSANGRWLAAASRDGVGLWDVQTGGKIRKIEGFGNGVSALSVSPDGRRILAAKYPRKAELWDAATDKIRTIDDQLDSKELAVLSPDGRWVATGDVYGRGVNLWDAETGAKIRSFEGHPVMLTALVFSADGRRLLTGSFDNSAIIWDAETGAKLRTLEGHSQAVWSVAASADGRRVLTGSLDTTAILWDAETGAQIRTMRAPAAIDSVAFSPDGKLAIAATVDGTARLWDLATGDELAALIGLNGGKDWLVMSSQGLFDGSEGGREQVTFRIGTGLNVVPVDRFFQDFYRPGLLAELTAGQRPKPKDAIGRVQPPAVKVVSPKDGEATTNPVTLVIEAQDQGGGVQGPWLAQNGVRVAAEGETERVGKVVRKTIEVTLVEGENRLEASAASGDGSWESEPAAIRLRYTGPMEKPELYVVTVGVSQYAQANFRLRYAAADASAIADLFRRRAPALYGPARVHTETLLDERATGQAIRGAIGGVAAKARKQDTLVLFVAGHGVMLGQRYYFIPHEFRTTPGSKVEADVRKQGIPADALAAFLTEGQALKRILILDTCASGGTVDLFQVVSRGSAFAFDGAIQRLSRNNGLYVVAASAASEEAAEQDSLGHGVLTYALLAGLRAVDFGPLGRTSLHPNRGDVADVLEWLTFAANEVPHVTKELGIGEQNVNVGIRGENFPILPISNP